MKHLLLVFCCLYILSCNAPSYNAWVQNSPDKWPQIAMINEVWYQNGEQYVHPSFAYAGSGFLLNYQQKTYAVTAKHVLWIATPKEMKVVNPTPYLERWIMHPKGNLADSVRIDRLINTDPTEQLYGEQSIQQRDWLVFSVQSASPNIRALTPSFRQLVAGESLYYAGCPYEETDCLIGRAKVLSARGNRIVFSIDDPDAKVNGASGSPLIDSLGYVVGILSGTSVNPNDGSPAFYGLSTHYLQKVFSDDPNKNHPLLSLADVLSDAIAAQGVDSAIAAYHHLMQEEDVYFRYQVLPEEFLRVASDLMEEDRSDDAIRILHLSLEDFYPFSRTHAMLGQIYKERGDTPAAKRALATALEYNPNNERAKELLESL
ncbi:MAG: trypsin-like peptidase domain-containing protein [Bacteroidota bacterium]